MIRYSLTCSKDHSFESWFQSAEAFEKLSRSGLLTCSICGNEKIRKSVMAPRIASKEGKESGPLSAPASPAEQALKEIRKTIEENSENVGKDFANEARRIHDGEAPERSIYGEAQLKDAKELIEDGIPVTPLPFRSSRKTN